MIITYTGKVWPTLRADQQAYVQHLMLSWRAHGPMGFYTTTDFNSAVRKARRNLP